MKSFKYKFNLSFSSEETVFNPSTSHVSKKVSKSFGRGIWPWTIYLFFNLFSIFQLHCAFVDFAKAFDTVWRDGLWHKLLLNNMNGNMFNVIVNMYKDTKSREIKYTCLWNNQIICTNKRNIKKIKLYI
jgi:hypothetical protein